MATTTISKDAVGSRITVHDPAELMDVSVDGFSFGNSADVNVFYDTIAQKIAETGEEFWFFLVNDTNTRIDSDAWCVFSRRGKELNKVHAMGSVRFRGSPDRGGAGQWRAARHQGRTAW